ncbi:MAG: hypothetical protein WB762_19520 [Candidatus Sulfotelmatobacter sp.]
MVKRSDSSHQVNAAQRHVALIFSVPKSGLSKHRHAQADDASELDLIVDGSCASPH